MNKIFKIFAITGLSLSALAACQYPQTPEATAYWQRVETHSALYLTGPKVQQQLEQDIATCTNEVRELVRLRALRETTPPNTHHPYHKALEESGDLAAFETPEHQRDLHVDHSDYYDFESCMRSKGWERVRSIRYAPGAAAHRNYDDTQDLRKYGATGRAADLIRMEERQTQQNYEGVND